MSDAICSGQSYLMPDGNAIEVGGPYTSILQTNAGCDSAITVQLTVHPLPDVSSGANDSYCLYDGDIELYPMPSDGSFSGDLISGTTLEHEGAEPGNYQVAYSVTDANGCTNVDQVNYVLATPIDPTFDFEMICNELELISTVSDPNDLFGYNGSCKMNWWRSIQIPPISLMKVEPSIWDWPLRMSTVAPIPLPNRCSCKTH